MACLASVVKGRSAGACCGAVLLRHDISARGVKAYLSCVLMNDVGMFAGGSRLGGVSGAVDLRRGWWTVGRTAVATIGSLTGSKESAKTWKCETVNTQR